MGKGERTREQILAAAAGVFSEYGYEKASVARICDAVGIARGTLYQYFRDKQSLFHALVDEQTRQILEFARPADWAHRDCPLPERALYERHLLIFEQIQDNQDLFRLMVREARARNPETEDRVRNGPTRDRGRDGGGDEGRRASRTLPLPRPGVHGGLSLRGHPGDRGVEPLHRRSDRSSRRSSPARSPSCSCGCCSRVQERNRDDGNDERGAGDTHSGYRGAHRAHPHGARGRAAGRPDQLRSAARPGLLGAAEGRPDPRLLGDEAGDEDRPAQPRRARRAGRELRRARATGERAGPAPDDAAAAATGQVGPRRVSRSRAHDPAPPSMGPLGSPALPGDRLRNRGPDAHGLRRRPRQPRAAVAGGGVPEGADGARAERLDEARPGRAGVHRPGDVVLRQVRSPAPRAAARAGGGREPRAPRRGELPAVPRQAHGHPLHRGPRGPGCSSRPRSAGARAGPARREALESDLLRVWHRALSGRARRLLRARGAARSRSPGRSTPDAAPCWAKTSCSSC